MKDHVHEALRGDAETAWRALHSSYPEARYEATGDGRWYAGTLRDSDEEIEAPGLAALIEALTARELTPAAPRRCED